MAVDTVIAELELEGVARAATLEAFGHSRATWVAWRASPLGAGVRVLGTTSSSLTFGSATNRRRTWSAETFFIMSPLVS